LMEILSAASLLSQIHIPYATLIKKWWKSSLQPPFSPSTCSLFNSCSKLMNILSEAFLLRQYTSQYIFLTQFLCKFDANADIQLLFKIDKHPPWSLPLPPLHISY
jgi:hypothetical protein